MNVQIQTVYTDYIEHSTRTERKIVDRLIRQALDRDYTVSVYDGEEWVLKNAKRSVQIKVALASTGENVLQFRDKDGTSIGKVWLIWGNDEDLISDHSDNAEIIEMVEHANLITVGW